MRYFLIDFENVSDSGLKGFFSLKCEDRVLLFYTQKANRISVEFMETILTHPQCASLRFFQVVNGNQALDLQLASFLGSLIAANEPDCEYFIVSKDKGFSCLTSFWTSQQKAIRLTQASSIAEALGRCRAESPARSAEAPAPAEPAGPEPQPEAPAEPAGPEPQPEAPAAAEPPKQEQPKPEQPKQEQPKPEQPKPSAPAKSARPAPQPQPQNEKSQLNNKVQMVLSKANYETQIISHVASLVSKTFGDKKIKQIVYRDLISEYGQKKGLEVYNHVKPLI